MYLNIEQNTKGCYKSHKSFIVYGTDIFLCRKYVW